MPGMDGFQVMEGLKTNDADAYLPVLVITAQPGHKLRALQAGAKDFISKPFDLVEARTRIHNMLEVRLLYRKLENYSKTLEAGGAGADRRIARKRSALPQPDRAGLRLVLGAGREREIQQGLRPGAGDARHPGRRAGGRRRQPPRRTAGTKPNARSCRRPSRPGSRSSISVFGRVNADGSKQRFRVSGEPMFNQSCRFIGYRGIGVEVSDK